MAAAGRCDSDGGAGVTQGTSNVKLNRNLLLRNIVNFLNLNEKPQGT